MISRSPSGEFGTQLDYKTFIVHVGQAHCPTSFGTNGRLPSTQLAGELFEEIALSQFNVAKTIIANPDAIVMNEGSLQDLTEENFPSSSIIVNSYKFNQSIALNIKQDFPDGFPDNYIELNLKQKNWLASRGAAKVLFSLEILHAIHKSDTPEEADKRLHDLKNISYFNPFYYHYRRLVYGTSGDPELAKFIFYGREDTVFRLCNALPEEKKTNILLVLLIYGDDHCFNKRFEEVKNLYPNCVYQGKVTTLRHRPEFSHTLDLIPSGTLICPGSDVKLSSNSVSEFIKLYRSKYPSTSFFSSGYRSNAMRALVKFLNTNLDEDISYGDIYYLLAKHEPERAVLFRDGAYPSGEKIKTATDHVLLELRNEFKARYLELADKRTNRFDM